MREYEEYYVAFIDVLGFKELLQSDSSCEEIYSVFDSLRNSSHFNLSINGVAVEAFDHVKHYIMSDSIVLYIKTSVEDSFSALLSTCLHLQQNLIFRDTPILLRGGIAKGSLFVDKDIIFGKGLSNAYQLENMVSKNPRIIFNRALLEEGKKNSKFWVTYGMERHLVGTDEDELLFINYLSPTYLSDIRSVLLFWDKVLCLCQYYLDTSYNSSLREKYIWLKKYALTVCRQNSTLILRLDNGSEFLKKWNLN